MNTIIEINTAFTGSGKSRRIKRTVLLKAKRFTAIAGALLSICRIVTQ